MTVRVGALATRAASDRGPLRHNSRRVVDPETGNAELSSDVFHFLFFFLIVVKVIEVIVLVIDLVVHVDIVDLVV